MKMKLPFSNILGLILKPYLNSTKCFCSHPTFGLCKPYTYLYGTLGLCINAYYLKENIGDIPLTNEEDKLPCPSRNNMIVHDIKIIATSMGLVQYSCLLIGCLTENPSLFLPHLTGQVLTVSVKLLNVLLLLLQINLKSLNKFRRKIFAIILMTFNGLQEFCVFRQYLCVCDF